LKLERIVKFPIAFSPAKPESMISNRLSAAVVGAVVFTSTISLAAEPLPSWNDTPPKQAILAFVERVTKEGSPDFVPVPERIATFDNDGTLWCEMPYYVQLQFALERVKDLAPQHPEWKEKEPFASLLRGDTKNLIAGGTRAILEVVAATQSGMTTTEYHQMVNHWIATAKNPITGRPVLEMVYQPMLELLAYLRANDFKTFIVSGSGVDFMRPWTEQIYGIPPEQVMGSRGKLKFERQNGQPVLVKLPELDFVDDKEGKPIGIQEQIGRRPIAAFGNSVGDREMLEWTQAGGGARLMMLVHHDDAAREFAYGPDSKIGTFSDSLMDEAEEKKWTIISMKDDWRQIFAFEKK
jgi:phosphoglycolate phosphatase-like HAD superfamily hydrolase